MDCRLHLSLQVPSVERIKHFGSFYRRLVTFLPVFEQLANGIISFASLIIIGKAEAAILIDLNEDR
jgi:hypothetical protein